MKKNGFTLVELLVVIAILGVVMSLAIPAYTEYSTEGKRVGGVAALMSAANEQERWFNANNQYSDNALPFAGTLTFESDGGDYVISVDASEDGFSYVASAAPANGHEDSECGTLAINQTGAKGQLDGSGAVNTDFAYCWNQ